jgi:hypothetical protein
MSDEEQQPSPNSIEEAVNQIKSRVQNFDKLEEMAEEAQRRPDLFYIYAIYQIVQMQEQLNQLLQNIGDLYTDSDASMN